MDGSIRSFSVLGYRAAGLLCGGARRGTGHPGLGQGLDLPAPAADARTERVDVRRGTGPRGTVPGGGGTVRAGHPPPPPPPPVHPAPAPLTRASPCSTP